MVVQEAPTSAAESFATGFWPETGAIAAVPAGFHIQVRQLSASRAEGEG